MRPLCRYIAVLLAVLAVSAAAQQKDDLPEPPAIVATDALMYDTLREVINHGADLYNAHDHAGCYRVYDGTLRTIKPLLANRPELQKVIEKAMKAAEAGPEVHKRAFALRAALDKVRTELKPKKAKDVPKEQGPKPMEDKEPKDKDGKEPKDKDKDKDKDGKDKEPKDKDFKDTNFKDKDKKDDDKPER